MNTVKSNPVGEVHSVVSCRLVGSGSAPTQICVEVRKQVTYVTEDIAMCISYPYLRRLTILQCCRLNLVYYLSVSRGFVYV